MSSQVHEVQLKSVASVLQMLQKHEAKKLIKTKH